jgi:hypothetical protein
MSSVGYGDIYPSTNTGRAIVLTEALFGAFLLAISVTALALLVTFEEDKKEAYVQISKE